MPCSKVPLSAAARKRFNETAAAQWFLTEAEGLPYGFHNLLFGWMDTPEGNYAPPVTSQTLMILGTLLDHVDHAVGEVRDEVAGQHRPLEGADREVDLLLAGGRVGRQRSLEAVAEEEFVGVAVRRGEVAQREGRRVGAEDRRRLGPA